MSRLLESLHDDEDIRLVKSSTGTALVMRAPIGLPQLPTARGLLAASAAVAEYLGQR